MLKQTSCYHYFILKSLFAATLCFYLSACGLYSSEGRKKFESDAGNVLNLNLLGCQNQTTQQIVQNYFLSPTSDFEILLYADESKEVWKKPQDNLKVTIETKRLNAPTSYQICTYLYSSEFEWEQVHTDFVNAFKGDSQ
jgi:hypothetical protein